MPPCIHGAFEKIWGGGQFGDHYVRVRSQRDVTDCDFAHRLWQKKPHSIPAGGLGETGLCLSRSTRCGVKILFKAFLFSEK